MQTSGRLQSQPLPLVMVPPLLQLPQLRQQSLVKTRQQPSARASLPSQWTSPSRQMSLPRSRLSLPSTCATGRGWPFAHGLMEVGCRFHALMQESDRADCSSRQPCQGLISRLPAAGLLYDRHIMSISRNATEVLSRRSKYQLRCLARQLGCNAGIGRGHAF